MADLLATIVGGAIGVVGSIGTLIASHYLRQADKLTIILSSSELLLPIFHFFRPSPWTLLLIDNPPN
jgi:hypothetical protein